MILAAYATAAEETPWGVLMLGWGAGWVFSMVIYVLVFAVSGSWRRFLEDRE